MENLILRRLNFEKKISPQDEATADNISVNAIKPSSEKWCWKSICTFGIVFCTKDSHMLLSDLLISYLHCFCGERWSCFMAAPLKITVDWLQRSIDKFLFESWQTKEKQKLPLETAKQQVLNWFINKLADIKATTTNVFKFCHKNCLEKIFVKFWKQR